MDLKRAWRNGFLASLIFAIPLCDLYFNPHSNLIVDDHPNDGRVQRAGNCGSNTSCASLADGNNDDIPDAITSWDNIRDSRLNIPKNTLTRLLFESGHTDFRDLKKSMMEFNPQDVFQSEWSGDVDLDTFGNALQNDDDDFGPQAFLSNGFGNPSTHSPGFSGPSMTSMFAHGGNTVSADSQNASGDGSESPFVDPLHESPTPLETGASIDMPSGNSNSGTEDVSIHNVPEPSSFVLIIMGTISVASLLYRKSKTSTRLC